MFNKLLKTFKYNFYVSVRESCSSNLQIVLSVVNTECEYYQVEIDSEYSFLPCARGPTIKLLF